jgi:hypothetical protein
MTEDYQVMRLTPLPKSPLKGRFLISEPVLRVTRDILVQYALEGIEDGGHEGLVFWAGRQLGDLTLLTTAIAPKAEHSAQRVWVSEPAVAEASRASRANQIGILSQIHSHPSWDARHSSGDDEMILMPFEGMLSIVIPNYGIGFDSISQACVHQYQGKRWVLCTESSVAENLFVIPTSIDLR